VTVSNFFRTSLTPQRKPVCRTTLVEKMRKYGMSRREEDGQDED
jgi:hypothetical protein